MREDSDSWRHSNVGRLLNNCIRRFESRVFDILEEAGHTDVRISMLSLTRNLDLAGTRVTELARRAGMTKQSMSETVLQGEKLGLVHRVDDELDGRAKKVLFTPRGKAWMAAFHSALKQAEAEMQQVLGKKRTASMMEALREYGREFDPLAEHEDKGSDPPKKVRRVASPRRPRRKRPTVTR